MNKDSYACWLRQYKNIHELGKFMNECVKRGIFHDQATKYKLLEEEMKYLVALLKSHLAKNQIHARPTKWVRDKDDRTTWISDPSFAYSHLL
ncbi:MAG: hypothetical protein V4440_07590, partial [Pseudomonadota bacterium]